MFPLAEAKTFVAEAQQRVTSGLSVVGAHRVTLAQKSALLTQAKTRQATLMDAITVMSEILVGLQQAVIEYIEATVNEAVREVYGPAYGFRLAYSIKRNQPQAEPQLVKNGVALSLRDECGGGVVDVVAFAMRICIWSLKSPRTRAVLILDEPFKFISRDLVERAVEVMRQLSLSLGIQFIVISHVSDVIAAADRAFIISQSGGISVVEEQG